jgi:DNA polymerase-1
VGAVFGFTRDLLFLLENKKPDFLFCAVDLPGKTFRHAMFEQYKANRKEMPEDLAPQIAAIDRVVDVLGIPRLACASYEADDVLATVARITEELDGHCCLVTADKDCRQLISDRVKLYNIRKDQVFDRAALGEEWGITPAQVIDFQALVGDSVDNVPGVPLIGPKLARQLLQQYGTLEQVLAHAHEVPGEKRRQNLIEGRQQALRSRELVRLDAHVPLQIDWEAGRTGRIDYDRAVDLFREFGFRSLTEKMESARGQLRGPTPARQATHHLVTSLDALQTLVDRLAQQRQIAVDLETTSVWPRWAEIVGYSLAWKEDESWYVPVRAPAGECRLDPKQTAERLRPVLENPAIEKVGQNLKYDMIVLRSAGIELAGVAFDTMVASYLLDAGQRNHNLDDLAKRYLHYTTTKIAELIGSGKNQRRMDEVPLARIAAYAGDDAMLPLRLRPILAKRLASEHLE